MFKGAQSHRVERSLLSKDQGSDSKSYSGHREITLLYASIKNSEFSIFISFIVIAKVFRHIMRGAFTEVLGKPGSHSSRLSLRGPQHGRHFEKPNEHIASHLQDPANSHT